MFSFEPRCHGLLRIAEVDGNIGRQRKPLVLRHLLAAIPRQRFDELVGQVVRLVDQRGDHRLAVAVGHLRQKHVTRCAARPA